jgi:hypothetical protein
LPSIAFALVLTTTTNREQTSFSRQRHLVHQTRAAGVGEDGEGENTAVGKSNAHQIQLPGNNEPRFGVFIKGLLELIFAQKFAPLYVG